MSFSPLLGILQPFFAHLIHHQIDLGTSLKTKHPKISICVAIALDSRSKNRHHRPKFLIHQSSHLCSKTCMLLNTFYKSVYARPALYAMINYR
jgi:hypothetical protein